MKQPLQPWPTSCPCSSTSLKISQHIPSEYWDYMAELTNWRNCTCHFVMWYEFTCIAMLSLYLCLGFCIFIVYEITLGKFHKPSFSLFNIFNPYNPDDITIMSCKKLDVGQVTWTSYHEHFGWRLGNQKDSP